MIFTDLLKAKNICFEENVSTASMSSIRTGGIATAVVYPKNGRELIEAVTILEETGALYKVIGGCTNTFFSDKGFSGAVIGTKHMREITELGNGLFKLEAGVSLSGAVKYLANNNLALGSELFGIPGSIGGAVRNNAGAFGKSISDNMVSGTFFDIPNKRLISLDRADMRFSYRRSILQDERMIFIDGIFNAESSQSDKILSDMANFIKLRRAKQPLCPSLGSFFKRNGEIIPAKLIDMLGLKGYSIGGASVSEKHAGFIVNRNCCASSEDVLHLADYIEGAVKDKYGIDLQREAEFVG